MNEHTETYVSRRKRRTTRAIVFEEHDWKQLCYINVYTQRFSRHSLFPNLTLEGIPPEDPAELQCYNYPYYTMKEPWPVYIARKHCERVDPCFQRPIARTFYRSRISYSKTCYNTTRKNRQLRKLEKSNAYSSVLFKFAERLECNPDPFFYGNYDFYYTGGNLCVLSNDDQYVINVADTTSNAIRVSKLSHEEDFSQLHLEEVATKTLHNKREIFQIAPLTNVKKMTNIFGARQYNNITIMKIEPEEKKVKLITEFVSKKTPFISFAQSADDPEIFLITTMKENVRVYNIGRKEVSITNGYLMSNEKNSIGWNAVEFLKNQSFIYANERQVSIIDIRTPKEDWLKTCSSSSKDYPCELISSLAKSQFENLFYVGSSHKLRCLDVRYLGKQQTTFESAALCEWTHQLDYPPLMMDVYHTNKRECIAISSPLVGDLRLCELTRGLNANCSTESLYKSYRLPWQPPTLQEARANACLAGKTLQPEADFKQRIRCCATGLAFYNSKKHKNDISAMLWSNSTGDVYAQVIEKRTSDNADQRLSQRSNEIMDKYASMVSELPQPDLNYTDIVDFKAMRKILLSKILSGDLIKVEEETVPEEKTVLEEETTNANRKKCFKGRWQKSIDTLHSYKDALAYDILSIWDMPKENEVDIKFSDLEKKFKVEKNSEDILNWLNRSETQVPTVSIPKNVLSSHENMDNDELAIPANLSQTDFNETDLTYTSANDRNYLIQETSFGSKRTKIAKSKKKHVKGF